MIYTAPNECSVLLYDWHRVYRLLMLNSTFRYTLHGKLIFTHLTRQTMDESGAESTEELHFFYEKRSDIVGFIDAIGNLVVEYRCDAWGKPISTTRSKADTLGKLNPFQYRGYV